MNPSGLARALPEGTVLLLDTTALAAYFEADEAAHPVAREIVDTFVASGRNPAFVSVVTVMELLIRPMRADPPRQGPILDFLRHHPNLTTLPLSGEMALAAARIRADHRLSPPDALIVGSALVAGARHLVTNDFEWRRKLARWDAGVSVCILADHRPS